MISWPQDLMAPPFGQAQEPGLLHALDPLRSPQREGEGPDLVVLLDGAGHELLAENLALTPTLRSLRAEIRPIRTVFPATTAVAMTSLHTGAPPLAHGVLGYRTLDPSVGRAVHQLSGEVHVDPAAWMPLPGIAETTSRPCMQVAPARHGGSLLSGGSFRAWRFLPHGRGDRVQATLAALRRTGRDGIVHLHVDDVDHTGHREGTGSVQWREALGEADAVLGALLRRAPRGTRVHVTADHGMVDTDPSLTVDLSADERLDRAVRAVSGEPRALMLHLVPDADPQVIAARAQDVVGERGLAMTSDEAVQIGLWGPPGSRPDARVAARLPEVLVLARGRWTSELPRLRPEGDRALVGVHGSLTSREAMVPLLVVDC